MPFNNKLFIYHVMTFLLLHLLGAANIITDLFISYNNGNSAEYHFSTLDLIASSTSFYIIQYCLVVLLVTSCCIYITYQAAAKVSQHVSNISSTLIHISISLLVVCSIMALNANFFADSSYLSLFTIESDTGLIISMSILLFALIATAMQQVKAVLAIMACLVVLNGPSLFSGSNIKLNVQPNVIFISIDSLRPELIERHMPFLQQQLSDSSIFTNAYTPFARTYPAWVSIITGKHPINHGARYNLQPESQLNPDNQYLPRILSEQGYHSVYASDERRFSNLGVPHGFDQVIGPRTGASDFILGNYADYPLSNLLTLLPMAKWVLPELYANRAAAHLYRPAAFSELLNTHIENFPAKPLFLAAHFCLPHWPYTFIGSQSDSSYPDKPLYPSTLQAVDQQIEALFKSLTELSLISNSRIVFLSDHGESWGKVKTGLKNQQTELVVMDYGHGMNILSPTSHRVLMGFKGFSRFSVPLNQPTSLMDITPTLLDELSIPDINSDGRSLLKTASSPSIISFESGVIITEANTANPDPQAIAKAAIERYSITPTGLLRLKNSSIDQMIQQKQLGIRLGAEGLFKLGNQQSYIHINYNEKSFSEHPPLETKSNPIFIEFCQLFSKQHHIIAKDCGI